MMKTPLLRPHIPAMLFAMAACSPAPEASQGDGPAATPAPAASSVADTPDATPASAQSPAKEIPTAFLGVWDHDKAGCEVPTDMRLEIAPKSLRFYESRGEVTRIEMDSPRSIVVSLAMEGEGEKWQMARKLTLSDNSGTLTESSVNEERIDPITLIRCDD